MSHFLLVFVSQFHVLHLFASPLLLDCVSLLLFVLVLTQSFYSQLLKLLAFLLLLSLESLYLSLLLPLLLLFLSPLLSLNRLLLLSLSQHSLRLLSLFPEPKPLLAPLLFSELPIFPALYFPSLVYVPLHVHLPFQYISALILLCLSLVAPSATQSVVSASLILLYANLSLLFLVVSVFLLSLLVPSSFHASVFPLQVSVFPLQVSVFLLSLLVPSSLHAFVSLHLVSSSSFASYFPLS